MAAPHRPVDPRASFPELEERVLERWRERDVFAESLRRRADAPPWGFYEGPPTANGNPGTHHVLSRVFKDIFPRFRTMTGHYVERKAGWDCHGLPVELAVEAELGFQSKADIEEYGIAEFNARCREKVLSHVEEWNRLTERIGFWVDLDHPYRTLDTSYVESVWWALKTIHEKGLLYEKLKVVPYCPRDETTLSSHELGQPDAYQRRRRPLGLRAPAGHRGPRSAPGRRRAAGVDDDALDARLQRRRGGPPGAHLRARPVRGSRRGAGRGARREGARRGARRSSTRFPGSALVGAAYEPPFPYIPADAYGPKGHTVLPAEFVTARGRHRPRPHRDRLRRGRLPPR